MIAVPGIGRSTAGAILSLSLNQHHPILDGNVKRVLARNYLVEGYNGLAKFDKALWQLTETLTPSSETNHYNQAMMDLGAMICTRSKPRCEDCPVAEDCQALKLQRQTDFPGKKPKKITPEKSAYMLVLVDNSQNATKVQLIQRPPAGIWGGLWCFAQFETHAELSDYLARHQLVASAQGLAGFRHTFSHFHLDIQPVLVEITPDSATSIMEQHGALWYNIEQPAKVGLAAATERILSNLAVLFATQ